MRTELVRSGQSLLDFATERTGSVEEIVDLAMRNGISITDECVGLQLVPTPVVDKVVAKLMGNVFNKPATALIHDLLVMYYDYTYEIDYEHRVFDKQFNYSFE